jgi:hypothetical protein
MSPSTSYPPEFIDLIKSVARLETKIDLILDQHAAQDGDIKSIKSRVESLERSRAHNKGVLAVLTAVGGIIGAIATTILKNYLPHNP